jgi:hypothetical protein
VLSILPGDNQARHALGLPALNRGRPWRARAGRLGSFGPVCEARTGHVASGQQLAILVVHGRKDFNETQPCPPASAVGGGVKGLGLVLDIVFNTLQGCATSSGNKIAVGGVGRPDGEMGYF